MHLGLCVSVSCPEVTPTNHILLLGWVLGWGRTDMKEQVGVTWLNAGFLKEGL